MGVFNVSLEQMVTYALLSSVITIAIRSAGSIAYLIPERVKSGEIMMDMLKPLYFHMRMLARKVGEVLFFAFTLGITSLLVAHFILEMRFPTSRGGAKRVQSSDQGVVLSHFQSLAGWTIWEIVFLYSIWVLEHSLFSLLLRHTEDLEQYITQGTFYMFMARQLPLLKFLGREINYTGFADLLVGIVGTIVALGHLSQTLNIWQVLYLTVVILVGTLIEFSITLALACIAFWTGRSASRINTVRQVSFSIQRYPIDNYGNWLRVFVSCTVLVAFINDYPAKFLLHKITPEESYAWLSFLSPVVALSLLGMVACIWRQALHQYSSTSC